MFFSSNLNGVGIFYKQKEYLLLLEKFLFLKNCKNKKNENHHFSSNFNSVTRILSYQHIQLQCNKSIENISQTNEGHAQ